MSEAEAVCVYGEATSLGGCSGTATVLKGAFFREGCLKR
jgi:hypothetical protein